MIIRGIFRKTSLFASAVVLSAAVAGAQSTTQGAIAGTVFDQTNAAIPSAKISIRNDATNAEQTLTSGTSGEYRAAQLAPGTYTVTISAPGFDVQKQSRVIVQVNEVTALDPHLTAGSESQQVDVTAQVPVIKLDSAEFGGHLDSKEIEAIPINNRRWSTLALTTPGVTNDANGFGLLSFRAISPLLNLVEIDGADDNQAFFAEERGRTRAGYSTSQAAVAEFQVNTGVYSAEFGRAVGGVVNSVTKSGGNQIHGEAYFYNRNSSRSAFQPLATNTVYNPTTNAYITSPYRPKDNRNEFGFNAGGPLIKDKLFWDYSFDGYRRNFPGTAKALNPGTFFVPPTLGAPGNGGVCNVVTGAVSTPPGGSAPSATDSSACLLAARENAVGQTATYASAANGYNTQLQAFLTDLGSVPRFGNQNINTPKLDWQVNSKNHVSFLYHRLRWDSPGGVQTQGTNNYAIDSFGTDFVKLDYGVAKLDTEVTSKLANEVRFQYGRELDYEGLQNPSAYTRSNLINSTGFAPEIALNPNGNGFYFGEPYYSFRVAYPDERKWQVGDTASYSFGKHSLRFGEDIVHNYDLQNNLYEGNGFISYSNTVNYFSDLITKTKSCDAAGSGVGAVGASYSCYSSYAAGFGPAIFAISTTDYGFFVEDDWKVTPRLTLNLGARYDFESIPSPYANLTSAASGAPSITASHPSDKNNIAPRIGFAYDPFGLGKTVVRGGFGLYYGRIPNAQILNAYENTGSPQSQQTPSYFSTTANAPTLQTPPTVPAPGTLSAYYLDNHLQNPYTEQFDLAVQQDLGYSNVLSVSYLGALGRELPNYLNFNLDPTKTYTIPYVVAPGSNGSCGPVACGTYNVKAYAGKQQTGTAAGTYNNILLNPNFGNITGVVSNINSSYHALSVDVTNRAFKYITFDANYTWAHALDFSQNQATAPGTENWLDPYANPRVNYGNSSLNVRHRAVGWAVFEVPGIHSHSALEYLTNGWSVRPYVQIQSGLPYSAVTTGTTPNQCYNAGCLEAAGSGIMGTSSATSYLPFLGRNTFLLPRTIVVDMRVQKDFRFAGRYTFQVFGEAFNLANHENVTGVSTSAYAIATITAANPTYPAASKANPVNTLTFSPTFGSPSTINSNYAYSPRLVQIGGRFVF